GAFGIYQISANSNGKYPAGELYKNVNIDEHGKQVIEFKDKEGKVILKKVQLTASADDGTGTDHRGWLCTYYIYDDLNNLRCVIQPEAVKKMSDPSTPDWNLTPYLNEQCFRYEYDQRNRMIMKKVPGAGEVYMVYDARDRLVMTQDANMRASSLYKWMVTKYDFLNRPAETGIWQDPNSIPFTSHLTNANNNSTEYPTTTSGYEQLSISHYDDYTALPAGLSDFLTTWNSSYFSATNNSQWPYPQMPQKSTTTKGMLTWTKTRIMGTSNFLSSVSYYDEKGRVIQQQTTNITGGTDVITTQYSWAGQPLVMLQKQEKAGTPNQTTLVVTQLTYDDLNRVTKTEKKISNTLVNSGAMSAFKTISTLQYDALGQLKKKFVGSKKDPATNDYYSPRQPLQELVYDYNIRGWLLGMNRDYIKDIGNFNFGFELSYDKLTSQVDNNIANTYSKAQFNGNIGGMIWKSAGDEEKRKYDFDYDAANRLLKADFTQYTSGWNNNAGVNFSLGGNDVSGGTMKYDANGNILEMWQKGLMINTSTWIDKMSYSYFDNSNKLKAVTDYVTNDNKLGDFTDKNPTVTDYGYDKNGNLITDLNKQINGSTGIDLTTGGMITYNYLNLPSVITVTGKGTITYTYDAAGNKLKKITQENASAANGNIVTTSTTTYVSGFVYESKTDNNPATNDYTDKLQFTGHEEGRIRGLYKNAVLPNALTGFEYDYMLKDHLGNVRMVLTEEQQQDIYPNLSFEGATGSDEVNNQNAIWEKADGTAFDVIGKRTSIQQLVNATNLVPATLTNSLLVRSSTGKVGAGKLIKVMSGDKINTTVQYYFSQNNENGATNSLNTLVSNLVSVLTNSIGSSSIIKSNPGAVASLVSVDQNAINFFSPQNSTTNNDRPKAYLNVLFFDEQFKFDNASSYSEQIGTTNPGQIVIALGSAKEAKKNGYCYIYISNETNDMVYFDNFTLKHERSSLIEETHYYPFGLTMAGISSKAA
ncbi:MAG: RHS repeat domain-containing protein, partial [Ferruginibacter sp.]